MVVCLFPLLLPSLLLLLLLLLLLVVVVRDPVFCRRFLTLLGGIDRTGVNELIETHDTSPLSFSSSSLLLITITDEDDDDDNDEALARAGTCPNLLIITIAAVLVVLSAGVCDTDCDEGAVGDKGRALMSVGLGNIDDKELSSSLQIPLC